jgi:hypothetical protein
MLKRHLFAVAGAVLLAVLGLGAARAPAAAARAAAAPATYTDPAGDAKSAPDITGVTISGAGTGTYDVKVDLGTMPNLAPDGVLLFGIDSDRNVRTGNQLGWEFEVLANSTGAVYLRWNGSDEVPFSHQPLSPRLTGTGIAFTLSKADLGGDLFDFAAATVRGDDIDTAPDDPPATFPRQIEKLLIPLTSLSPRAGKVFRFTGATVQLDTGETVTPEEITCRLTYKGTELKPLAGGCAWRIPKKLRKKQVVLEVTLSYGGASVTQTYPLRVRK